MFLPKQKVGPNANPTKGKTISKHAKLFRGDKREKQERYLIKHKKA
jgi:hypothetical protein